MKRGSTHGDVQAPGRSLDKIVGQFIYSECLGNFYVNAPSGDIIAMTPRRKFAQAIADAMNRSNGRTADKYHRRVVELETAIRKCLKENAHLADGEDCTLIVLKKVLMPNPTQPEGGIEK